MGAKLHRGDFEFIIYLPTYFYMHRSKIVLTLDERVEAVFLDTSWFSRWLPSFQTPCK